MTTHPTWIKRPAAYAVPAMMLFLLFEACGGGGGAVADEAPAAIEGVWESVITVNDCTTHAPLANFVGSQVFHRGGTLTDTNGSPPTTRGPGFGTWTGSGSSFTAKFRFYTYDATGQLTGTTRVTRNITVAADGNTVNSVNTNQAEDTTGKVIRTVCATDVSTRVK